MEEKKRKKQKKKKNRSEQPDDIPDVAVQTTTSENPEIDLPNDCSTAAERGIASSEPSNVLQGNAWSSDDPALICAELRQLVQELRNALNSKAWNSPALCGLPDDVRNVYTTSQAKLDCSIHELRGEVIHLSQAASLQNNKEACLRTYNVDLAGSIQHLREEILHLKAIKEAEREKKAVDYMEIQQLREGMVKLTEDSTKQTRMVEEMSDTLQQLLKNGQLPIVMDSCQLTHVSADSPSASEAGVTLSSKLSQEQLSLPRVPQLIEAEPSAVEYAMLTGSKLEHFIDAASANVEKVNGHCTLMEHSIQSHMKSDSGQVNSSDVEKIEYYASSAEPSVVEKHMGIQAREVSVVDSSYIDQQKMNKKSADDHGVFVDNTEFVTVNNQVGQAENNLHHEIPLETTNSDLPQPTHMQVINLKPLADAPITGAPIRLFRFVARYVSGADLVK